MNQEEQKQPENKETPATADGKPSAAVPEDIESHLSDDQEREDAANSPDAEAITPEPYVDPMTLAEEKILALEEEALRQKDVALRALAEAENTRKRSFREVEDSKKYGVSSLARDILTLIDNLERALTATPETTDENDPLHALKMGVDMTLRDFLNTLDRHGVKKVEPVPGEKFDHNLHQAMFEAETNEHPPGSIAKVVQAGYVIHDRLLRPALVGVAKQTGQVSDHVGDTGSASPANDSAPDESTHEPTPDTEKPDNAA
jgi:molecular chaperone GrpE